jgi:DinB superfamily
MTRQELTNSLIQSHTSFINYINALSAHDFEISKQEKWAAGQQLEHIVICTNPLTQALLLPKFVVKMLFGKANRQSKSFDEIVAKYTLKLQNGGKASSRFIPKAVSFGEKEKLINTLNKTIKKLTAQLNGLSDEQLDTLILPHPLLGKLTLREMIYFTIYHVKHHHDITVRNLESWKG